MSGKSVFCVAATFGSLALAGCGGSDYDGPTLYPVTASVTQDGQPFKDVSVSLIPEEEGRPPAYGTVTPEGKASFNTGPNEGVAAGNYKVVLQWNPPPDAYAKAKGGPPKPPFPEDWTNPTKTPKTVTVPDGGTDDLKIEF